MRKASRSDMRKVLITGIRGFTGRYLAGQLRSEGYEVCGLAHDEHAPESGVYQCDLLDRTALGSIVATQNPSHIVHLAAIAFVAHGSAEGIYSTNVVGTRNLLEAAAAAGGLRSVLLASSANIYGNTDHDPLDESVTPAPANDYAVSKLAMEYMARLWLPKLPITLVRPFNYTGVGQSADFLLPKIVDHFKRGAREIELGNLDVARDFSDVRMVVKAYAKLLALGDSDERGETFNVCSGKAYSLQDVIAIMERIAGYKIQVKVNPAFVRQGEVRHLRGSHEKLKARIGPLDTQPLEDTLRWMYAA
jgi:GDP-6-deoxy-D-talose 4-dehydrogenase